MKSPVTNLRPVRGYHIQGKSLSLGNLCKGLNNKENSIQLNLLFRFYANYNKTNRTRAAYSLPNVAYKGKEKKMKEEKKRKTLGQKGFDIYTFICQGFKK